MCRSALLLPNCATLSKCLHLSEPQSVPLWNGMSRAVHPPPRCQSVCEGQTSPECLAAGHLTQSTAVVINLCCIRGQTSQGSGKTHTPYTNQPHAPAPQQVTGRGRGWAGRLRTPTSFRSLEDKEGISCGSVGEEEAGRSLQAEKGHLAEHPGTMCPGPPPACGEFQPSLSGQRRARTARGLPAAGEVQRNRPACVPAGDHPA